jgi:hypothetical protein
MNNYTTVVISFLFLFYFTLNKCEINFEKIDFSPFHQQIQKVLLNSKNISTNINTFNATQCSMPHSSIMFTYSTFYSIELIKLQYKAMEQWGLKNCLLQRFIVVCLDSNCKQFCYDNNILNCVLIAFPEKLQKSDFGENSYHLITYVKHELIYEALKYSNEIFYFDIDCLLFKNPWIGLKNSLFESFHKTLQNNIENNNINYSSNRSNYSNINENRNLFLESSSYDMFYQFERGFFCVC